MKESNSKGVQLRAFAISCLATLIILIIAEMGKGATWAAPGQNPLAQTGPTRPPQPTVVSATPTPPEPAPTVEPTATPLSSTETPTPQNEGDSDEDEPPPEPTSEPAEITPAPSGGETQPVVQPMNVESIDAPTLAATAVVYPGEQILPEETLATPTGIPTLPPEPTDERGKIAPAGNGSLPGLRVLTGTPNAGLSPADLESASTGDANSPLRQELPFQNAGLLWWLYALGIGAVLIAAGNFLVSRA